MVTELRTHTYQVIQPLSANGLLQRKCACGNHTVAGGECENCRKKREGMLQRSAASSAPVNEVPPIVHEVLRSPGQPLDPETRAFMEPRFGYDFSHVRIHTDGKAAESARLVNALAYTVGSNMVFASDQYQPNTIIGKQLLAHEMTHVVQQSLINSEPLIKNQISHPQDASESEADKVASKIIYEAPLLTMTEPSRETQPNYYSGISRFPGISPSPAMINRKEWFWPINGYVINKSSDPVTVWSDKKGVFTIAPDDTSQRFTEDVDHVMDKGGQWYKIGPNTVTVDEAGRVNGYECKVSTYGEACPSTKCVPEYLGHGDYLGDDCIIRPGPGPKS
ncbi:DUF4157 domain-containing protein [bacterium]|nr:DUF4157 domain-containing protein [bacterium]